MIEPLLELPAHVRRRLVGALETGLLAAPYEQAATRAVLGAALPAGAVSAMRSLADDGMPPRAIALALRAADRAAARSPGPELVWSGPEVAGLHARDTRRVYEELVARAQRSLWLSTYTYYDGPKAFRTLAARMEQVPELQVRLLLNIQRRAGDTSAADQLVMRFSQRLWSTDWPGPRRPEVFYDPRALDPAGAGGVLHAKAVVVDDEVAFVTSANLTEAAFDRNIEAGVLARDRALAATLARHFRVLIEQSLLVPLP